MGVLARAERHEPLPRRFVHRIDRQRLSKVTARAIPVARLEFEGREVGIRPGLARVGGKRGRKGLPGLIVLAQARQARADQIERLAASRAWSGRFFRKNSEAA